MTALTEHILDTALQLANVSPWGRLCPPMLACLDELPSTAPLPTLRTRMANERALGISFIYAAQTWRQLAAIFGEQEARALFGLSNVLVIFGGSKDVAFNQEVSDLVGTTRVKRTTWQSGGGGSRGGRSTSGEDIPVRPVASAHPRRRLHGWTGGAAQAPVRLRVISCMFRFPFSHFLYRARECNAAGATKGTFVKKVNSSTPQTLFASPTCHITSRWPCSFRLTVSSPHLLWSMCGLSAMIVFLPRPLHRCSWRV